MRRNHSFVWLLQVGLCLASLALAARSQGGDPAHGFPDAQPPSDEKPENPQANPPRSNPPSRGDPVDLFTGDLTFTTTDLRVASRGMDLALEHSYQSGYVGKSAMGRAHNFNWFQRIVLEYHWVPWPKEYPGPGDTLYSFPYEPGTEPPAGWTHPTHFAHLDGAYYYDGTTRIELFQFDTTATNGLRWKPPAGYFAKLLDAGSHPPFVDPTSMVLRTADGTVYTFGVADNHTPYNSGLCKTLWLSNVTDRKGNSIDVLYEWTGVGGQAYHRAKTVIDTLGRQLTLGYDATTGWLQSATDYTGRSVAFGHDVYGNLESVTTPAVPGFASGRQTRYGYGATPDDHEIASIIDAREVADSTLTPYLNNVYDSQHRVVKQLFGDDVTCGGWYRWIYEPQGPGLTSARTLVIDPNGNVELRSFTPDGFDTVSWRFTGRIAPEAVPDTATIPDLVTLGATPDGSVDALRSDAPGYQPPLRAGDPPSFVTTKSFNSDGLITLVVSPGARYEYEYDSQAADRFQRGNLLVTTQRPVPDNGEEPLVQVRAYEPFFNQPRAVIDPRGNATAYRPQNGGTGGPDRYRAEVFFDYQEGDLSALSNLATTWAIDVAQPSMFATLGARIGSLAPISPAGSPNDLNGDGITDQVRGNAIVTRWPTVMAVGPDALSSGFVAQPSEIRYRFNGFSELASIVDAEQGVTTFAYYSEEDPDGDSIATPAPPNGRVLDTATGANGGGYLRYTVQPGGIAVQRHVDALGRVIEDLDGRGFSTKYAYDATDQLLTVTDERGYVTASVYDGNKNVVERRVTNKVPTIDPGTQLPTGAETARPDIVDHFTFDLLNELTVEDRQADPADGSAHLRLLTMHRYDKLGNGVLTRLPQSVAQIDLPNLEASVLDERNFVFLKSLGGMPGIFSSLSANANVREASAVGGIQASSLMSVQTTNYTPAGVPSETIDGEGKSATNEYDAFLRLVRSVDPLGNTVEFTLDPAGKTTHEYHYDVASNLVLRHRSIKYDERGREFEFADQILPAGSIVEGSLVADGCVNERRMLDRNGRVVQQADDNGSVVQFAYDGLNRNTLRTDAAGNSTALTYDGNGNVIEQTDAEVSELTQQPSTFVSRFFFDELDRLTAKTDSLLHTTRYLYDSRGNVVYQSDARSSVGGVALQGLDAFGEHAGLSGLVTNGHGNSTRREYDDAGRCTASATDMRVGGVGSASIDTTAAGDGQIVGKRTYDLDSRLTAEQDDLAHTTTYELDALNRLRKTTFADGTAELRTYDRRGLMTSISEPNRHVATMVYDDAGRLKDKTIIKTAGTLYGTSAEHYDYDGMGRVLLARDDDSTVMREYDALSRVTSEQIDAAPATLTSYDGVGNLRSLSYPGGRVATMDYDSVNRLHTVSVDSTSIASYSYVGWRVEQRLNPATSQMMRVLFDGERRPTEVRHSGAGGVGLGKWKSEWDAVSNKTARTYAYQSVDQVRHAYSYDSADRLIQSDRLVYLTTGLNETQTYDMDGALNRLAVSGQSYTLSATNPEPADFQVNQYTTTPFDSRQYDKNGNLTVMGSATIKYDYRNQMVEFAQGSAVTSYAYDCFGRRIAKSTAGQTSRYYYGGRALIEERDGSGVTIATSVYGRTADDVLQMKRWNGSAWATTYFLADDLSNVMKAVDSASAPLESYDYADYGQPLDGATLQPLASSSIGNPWLFSGRQYDSESGLYYFRARYLDPLAGRFTTRDPIGMFGDAGNRGNGYAYVGNNPWSFRDASGLQKGAACGGMLGPDQAAFIAAAKQIIEEVVKTLNRIASELAKQGNTGVSQGLSALGSAIGAASGQLGPPPSPSPGIIYVTMGDSENYMDPLPPPDDDLICQMIHSMVDILEGNGFTSEELEAAYKEIAEGGSVPKGYRYLDFLRDTVKGAPLPNPPLSSQLEHPDWNQKPPSTGSIPAPTGRDLTSDEIKLSFSWGCSSETFPGLCTPDNAKQIIFTDPTKINVHQFEKAWEQGVEFGHSLHKLDYLDTFGFEPVEKAWDHIFGH